MPPKHSLTGLLRKQIYPLVTWKEEHICERTPLSSLAAFMPMKLTVS